MINVAYASDLHFEFHKADKDWMPVLATGCDVIILAGDIGVGNNAIKAVKRIGKAHPDTQILYLAGNHEFYKTTIEKQIQTFRDAFTETDNIHFLENDVFEFEGWHFLGCTLWSDFAPLQGQSQADALTEAQTNIIDFHLIRTEGGKRPFTPMDAAARHRESAVWLERELENHPPDKTIVATHFPPSRKASHKKIPENPLTPYFQANCEQLILKYQPKAWIYGHNHWSEELYIGNTQLASNQLGYPDEETIIPGLLDNGILSLD